MTLYDRMIQRSEDLERVALKALYCKPNGVTMVGCHEYYRRLSEDIRAWTQELCMDCAAKENE